MSAEDYVKPVGVESDRWCSRFFDIASTWWPAPETEPSDGRRPRLLQEAAGRAPLDVLELGCGSGATALAAARQGYRVTGVDISRTRIQQANLRLADSEQDPTFAGNAKPVFLHGDFYSLDLTEQFDVVTYWNGFGVGSDDQQRFLLSRMCDEWLRPGGIVIVDIYAPWRWAAIDGQREEFEGLVCENSFDPLESRFTERWSRRGSTVGTITQYGRCYTPKEFRSLLDGLDLEVVEWRLGEAAFELDVEADGDEILRDAWDYTAILRAFRN
jgi:SAM-dependent methyltransferase